MHTLRSSRPGLRAYPKSPPLLAIILAITGCSDFGLPRSDGPTHPSPLNVRDAVSPNGALPQFPELAETLPAVRIADAAPEGLLELTDEELAAAVVTAGGHVIIGLKPGSSPRTRETGIIPAIDRATALDARRAVERVGVKITQTYRHSSAIAALIAPELVPVLRSMPVVDYVEPSIPLILVQSPPPQDTAWGVKKIGAPIVWSGLGAQSTRGELANVTMLDSGIDSIHRWSPSGDGPANVGLDCYWVAGTGSSCYDDTLPLHKRGHGAHVGGIIAGRNNAFGWIGVAHEPFRFASIKVCDLSGTCMPQWIAAALDWVASSGQQRHIINMSLGGCVNHTLLAQSVAAAAASGALLVGAAGNTDIVCPPNHLPHPLAVMWPARYPQVMAVAGTLQSDGFATPGNGGFPAWCEAGSRADSHVEIGAPYYAFSMRHGGTYVQWCGTSMAAPHVTGAAAMVWSRNPSWTAAQVRSRLNATGVPVPGTHFRRVSAFNAVYTPPPSYAAWISGVDDMKPFATCNWLAATDSPDGPFSYEWAVDSAPSGGGPHLTFQAGSGGFTISLKVTDAVGREMFASKPITVHWGAGECWL